MTESQIDCQKGLLKQKRLLNHLGCMHDRSEQLHKVLDAVLKRTYACAPMRSKEKSGRDDVYLLTRDKWQHPNEKKNSERRLEQAIWKHWKKEADIKPEMLCRHIQTCQMPLRDARDEENSNIDLVGVTEEGLPIVLELKQENSKDTPLGMLAQGLAYAVAVKKAWNEGCFREEWVKHVTQLPKTSESISRIPVIGIAPCKYWKLKMGIKGKQANGQVPEAAWKPFKRLCNACSDRGFPVSFLQFTCGELDSDGLPTVADVSPVPLPEF